MKRTHQVLALCALAALPLGSVVAGQLTSSQTPQTEVRAADAETQVINLKITGMR